MASHTSSTRSRRTPVPLRQIDAYAHGRADAAPERRRIITTLEAIVGCPEALRSELAVA
jgi:hypothetical protein